VLLEVLEGVIFLESFPFVKWHYTKLANIGSLTPFLVNCANMALPSRMLSLAMFSNHNLCEGMYPHITRKSPRGVKMRPAWGWIRRTWLH
jgi:hypothetical protein